MCGVMEPNLAAEATAGGALWFPDGWFLRDPAALLQAMADGYVKAGGELLTGAQGSVRGHHGSPQG